VDGEPRSATATSARNSKLAVVSREDFERVIEAHPRVGCVVMRNFARILAARARKTTRDLRASLLFS
jgi:CRP-like cAMP-binding protein